MSASTWRTETFDRVVISRGSGSASLPKKEWQEEGSFPVIGQGAAEIEGWTDRIELLVKVSDPIVLYGGHTRRAKLIKTDFVPGPNAKLLRPKNGLLPEFLYFFLQSVEVEDKGYGDHFPLIRKVPIPVPPLREQKRIVEVLDQAFVDLDRAHANAEANLADADAVLSSFVEDELKRSGGDVLSLQEMMDSGLILGHLDGNHGSNYPRKSEFVESGVPYISANCIIDGEIDLGKAKFLTSARAATIRKGVARDGDVIFAHNATVGPVALLETEAEKVILSTSVTYYRPDSKRIMPQFLMYEMRSAAFRRQYEAVMHQATRNQVPITAQRKLTHTIPDLAEQERLVATCSEIESASRQLEEAYTEQCRDLDELRQSILQKAFAGALI